MGRSKSTDLFWNFYQNTDGLTGEEEGFLSCDEKLRLAGMRFEKRRNDWLTGRWAAKSLLARSGMLPSVGKRDHFQILNEESGAPFAADLKGVRLPGCLSISHRAGAAFCAFSSAAGVQLGVDLELIEPKEASFFEDYFTPSEKSLVLGCGEKQRNLAILLAWSGKEAVFKALGTGLRMDTRSVETGGFGWIADQSITENEWYDLFLSCAKKDFNFQGRWMLRGSYVMVLARRIMIGDAGWPILREV